MSRFGPETLVLYRKRTGATASVSLDLRSSLSIQPFEGGRFVRGGRYGISIDFSSEVVEKRSICGASFKSKFIDLTMKPRLTIASSYHEPEAPFCTIGNLQALRELCNLALGA